MRKLSPVMTVVTGIAIVVVGALLGFIVGANIGGNWFTSVALGDLHGYEATAAIGAVAGAVAAAGLALVAHRARGQRAG
jgi:hypothetical protein